MTQPSWFAMRWQSAVPTRRLCVVALLALATASTSCSPSPAGQSPRPPGPIDASSAGSIARVEPTSNGIDGAVPASDAAAPIPVPTASGPSTPATAAFPVDDRLRLGSIGATTWIYPAPLRRQRLGSIRPGNSVLLRAEQPPKRKRPGPAGGCNTGRWYAVLPVGFVCEDETVTLDLSNPTYRAYNAAGAVASARPFEYAFSTRAPMYSVLPSLPEQKRAERHLRPVADLGEIPRSTAGHEDLADAPQPTVSLPVPSFLEVGGTVPAVGRPMIRPVAREIPYGSMLSYRGAFDLGGRTFLLSPDLTAVPADRMRPYRATSFRGVHITEAEPLPIGWFRKKPRAQYRSASGGLVETDQAFAPRTHVGLTGKSIQQDNVTYLETRTEGIWVRASDVSVVEAPKELPEVVGEDEKWIEISLSKGTLTLLVGRRTEYSTLVSPGAGGVTSSVSLTVEELVRGAFSPLGSYRIVNKYVTARMTTEDSPDPEKFWIADVPWVQYFRAPFALHTTYWHEDFGQPKSGGCINLSPEDAKLVFDWTSPTLPEGWSAVFARAGSLGTRVIIHK